MSHMRLNLSHLHINRERQAGPIFAENPIGHAINYDDPKPVGYHDQTIGSAVVTQLRPGQDK